MKKIKWDLTVFYILTFILTILFAVGQQQLKISYDKITLPQLAPLIAVICTFLLFATSRTTLNFNIRSVVIPKLPIAFVLPFIVFGIGFYVCKMLGLNTFLTDNLIQSLPLSLIGMLIGAAGEEIGWRGFLQPNLERKYSVLVSSIITGLMWGLWHIGHYKNGVLFMIGFLLFTVSASVIVRRILERTNNNLIIPVLFHFSINIGFVVFYKSVLTDPKMILTNGILWTVLALATSFVTNHDTKNKQHTT
jgi:uncharacterized protein